MGRNWLVEERSGRWKLEKEVEMGSGSGKWKWEVKQESEMGRGIRKRSGTGMAKDLGRE